MRTWVLGLAIAAAGGMGNGAWKASLATTVDQSLYDYVPHVLPGRGRNLDLPGIFECGEGAEFTEVLLALRFDTSSKFLEVSHPGNFEDPMQDWINDCTREFPQTGGARRVNSCEFSPGGVRHWDSVMAGSQLVAQKVTDFDESRRTLTMSVTQSGASKSRTLHCRAYNKERR